MKKYFDLIIAFTRAGILGFGGGVACLPLIKREVVDNYKWLKDENEFAEIVGISNTLPGPINTKMAGYVGYKVAGILGAIIAVCSTILPSVIALILLLETLTRFRQYRVVIGMLQAIVPVVGVMLGIMAWQFISSAAKDLTWIKTFVQVGVVFILVGTFNLHPAIVIAILILLAFIMPVKNKKEVK